MLWKGSEISEIAMNFAMYVHVTKEQLYVVRSIPNFLAAVGWLASGGMQIECSPNSNRTSQMIYLLTTQQFQRLITIHLKRTLPTKLFNSV